MYMLDPDLGRRRRAIAKDKLKHMLLQSRRAADLTTRDMFNRAWGLGAGLRHRLKPAASDEVLVARVRAALGRRLANAGSISVSAQSGSVSLSGAALRKDAARLLRAARGVPGVRSVEDLLEVHDALDDIPALQPGLDASRASLPSHWPPATRFVAVSSGIALTAYGLERGGLKGSALALAGVALCVRGITNTEITSVLGVGGAYPALQIQKAIAIAAPVHQVFRVWSDYSNFPHFMSHVLAVEDLGNGRSHWTVEGPAGVRFEWDAVVTDLVPDRVLAWRSEPGATVHQTGVVRFEPVDNGAGTRVHLRLSYAPPAGLVGHAFASLFTSDLKREVAEDLLRMKASIETGLAWQEAAQSDN
jgi:uncharacterized membrane protein